MLSIKDVSHQYGKLHALAHVSLQADAAATGLLGANGAGKSTLLAACAGALKPSTGEITLDGESLYSRGDRARVLKRVALMPQHLAVPGHLTAQEAVSYLTWMRGARWREATRLAHQSLVDVGLEARASTKVKSLSGGMQRRVALAQALATSPDVLLLDEPTTGLDPEQRRGVLDLVSGLPHLLIMSSHIVEDIAHVAKHVWVLDRGAVSFDGSVDKLRATAPDPTAVRALEEAFMTMISREVTT